jgi:DNA-binding transcriptional LysR family regulator
MVSNVNLNDIYTFHCVSELKSITAASKKLKTSKQTISRKLAQLEEALGVTLVARNSRSFKLTDAGKEYNSNCANIIKQIEDANALVQQHQMSAEGTIKICMSHELTHSKTCELVINFLKENPTINLDISLCDKNAFSVSDGFDLGLRLGNLEDSSLVARSLGGVNYALMASPKYLKVFGMPTKCEDLVDHTYISVTKSSCPVEKELPLNKCRQLAVSEFMLAKQFAAQGFGLARLPLFMCADSLEANELVILPSTQCMEVKPLNMVYRKDKLMPGYLRLFIDFMVEVCREKRPWILDMTSYLYAPPKTAAPKEVTQQEAAVD